MIALAFRTVLKRWAMTNTVLPSMSWSIPFFDQRLGSGVNGRCCLVKNQHRRIGNGGTGNREKLALAWERLAPSEVSIVS